MRMFRLFLVSSLLLFFSPLLIFSDEVPIPDSTVRCMWNIQNDALGFKIYQGGKPTPLDELILVYDSNNEGVSLIIDDEKKVYIATFKVESKNGECFYMTSYNSTKESNLSLRDCFVYTPKNMRIINLHELMNPK